MKIGIDISTAGASRAGCGVWSASVATLVPPRFPSDHFVLYPQFGDRYHDRSVRRAWGLPSANCTFGPVLRSREAFGRMWTGVGRDERLGSPDVIHCNNFWCPPEPGPWRIVYTVYDLSFLTNPDWHTEANRMLCASGMLRAACVADRIVAISEASRSEFLVHFPNFPSDRVDVVRPVSRFGPGSPLRRPACMNAVGSRPFWLYVSTIEPRKNHDMLLRAYALHRASVRSPWPLVLAGGIGWKSESLARRLAEAGAEGEVICTGRLPDDELAWLLAHCEVNLFPSLHEGFGLPVLEAICFGKPQLVADVPSLREIVAEGGLIRPGGDVDAWVDAMRRLVEEPDLRRDLADRAAERAVRFAPADMADAMRSCYGRAFDGPRRCDVSGAASMAARSEAAR